MDLTCKGLVKWPSIPPNSKYLCPQGSVAPPFPLLATSPTYFFSPRSYVLYSVLLLPHFPICLLILVPWYCSSFPRCFDTSVSTFSPLAFLSFHPSPSCLPSCRLLKLFCLHSLPSSLPGQLLSAAACSKSLRNNTTSRRLGFTQLSKLSRCPTGLAHYNFLALDVAVEQHQVPILPSLINRA